MKTQKLLIKNLHASVEDKEILKGISMEIKPGEVHAVMGPNGGGKSTLAQVLMGHPSFEVQSLESRVQIDGEDILELSPDRRAQMGLFLAFQYPVSVVGVSVQKFLWQAYQALHPEDKISVIDFRKEMKVLARKLLISEDLLKRSLNDGFSGGEKKRIEILQLLLLKPKYVILDEIDSGLDVDAIGVVADGIKEVVKSLNVGVLIITHYQRILKYLKPDRVHVLVDGEIVRSGDGELAEELEKSGYGEYVEAKNVKIKV